MLTKLQCDFLRIVKSCFDNKEDIFELSPDMDFESILNLADEHGLGSLIYNKIYAVPFITKAVKQKWTDITFFSVSSQVARQDRFLDIYSELCRNGINAIVIKGVTLRDIYPVGDCRPSGDEDIFVDLSDIEKVRSILEASGMKYDHGSVDEWVYRDDDTKLIIEIHTKLIESFISLKYDFLSQREPRKVMVDDVELFTLDYTENCLYIFFHIYQHFLIAGVGIRQLCDLFQYINLFFDKIQWGVIEKALNDNDLVRFFNSIINIGHQYLFLRSDILNVDYIDVDNLLNDIIAGGIYGGSIKERSFINSYLLSAVSNESENKLINRIRMVFPGYNVLKKRYSYINGKPFLLPVAWINRFYRIVKSGQFSDSCKSVYTAESRMNLFLEYGILKKDR